MSLRTIVLFILLSFPVSVFGGQKQLIHSGWVARQAASVLQDGAVLTSSGVDFEGWMPAVVPGTVLTTMLENKLIPDPDFGMNNELIPDIYDAGRDYYTYWFVNRFTTPAPAEGEHLWLNFRGINYRAEIFLNGKRISTTTHEGMFVRRSYDITRWVKPDGGENTLAVLVYPPDHVGRQDGQAGDGYIARNVTMQFTAGWDWIQAVRDRNTGIWDEVSLTRTGPVRIEHPQVVTSVPGVRTPDGRQADAIVKVSAEVENLTDATQTATVSYTIDGRTLSTKATLAPRERRTVAMPDMTVKNPRLWWPNGIGKAELYPLSVQATDGRGRVSDTHDMKIGIRELTYDKDPANGGRRFFVNGQKIFIRGGNYICSDWMLRLSRERYYTEVKFHAEMNLNMIRVWGGAIPERPEFYEACDELGMLVFQDFPISGDGNGAWVDPMKKDSKERRMEYPDDHELLLASITDEVKMLRNHPSLALWCGGNEWPAPEDVDEALKTRIMPSLDPTRMFASFSTDTLFTRNTIGGVGDGPYGIQEIKWFFNYRSTPFNPELGSVGLPEAAALRAIMTEADFNDFPRPPAPQTYVGPVPRQRTNEVWNYHKMSGYGQQMSRIGMPETPDEFAKLAQLLNYDQYRGLMEGWGSKMWNWYTGMLIWKTQNPWTALRGQMYDVTLDVNACFYGTKTGGEPLHIQYNAHTGEVELVNTTLGGHDRLTATARLYAPDGRIVAEHSVKDASVDANTSRILFKAPAAQGVDGVYFLRLTLAEAGGKVASDNTYWLTTVENDYSGLLRLPASGATSRIGIDRADGVYNVSVTVEGGRGVSFFNHVAVFDRRTGERVLPVHYSDNYFTVYGGETKTISLTFPDSLPLEDVDVRIGAWN
jgi:hypothetical protein